MTGRLLFFILMYFLHEIQAQAYHPPKLTVNPAVITQADSVTLSCQPPSDVSVSQCYFYTLSGGTVRIFSCMTTLTGTELLKWAHQRSPAEVKVKCFYMKRSRSADSNTFFISVRNIVEEELGVTLTTPTVMMTTGVTTTSPHAFSPVTPPKQTSASLPFKLTVTPAVINETDSVTLNCQTPSSVSVSQCYFYALSGGPMGNFPCLQTLTGTELLKMAPLGSPAEVKVTCYYAIKFGEINYLSAHSEISSITIHKKESTTITATFRTTTGLTDGTSQASTLVTHMKKTSGVTAGTPSNTDSSTSAPVKTASAETWKFIVVVTGCGATVGVILLVFTVFWNQRRTDSEEVRRQEHQNENFDTYHLYATIAEEPVASDLNRVMYSTVQKN